MERQHYSNEFKVQVIKEAEEVGNKAAVARRYGITPNMLHRWQRQLSKCNDNVKNIIVIQ